MLEYKADRRTLAAVGLYFGMTVFAWFNFPSEWYLAVPLVITLCMLSFVCAVTVHNTIHHPIFKKKWMNKIYQVVLSFTYGHPVSAYVSGHNFSHHMHMQEAKDRIRTTQMSFRLNILNQILLFFVNALGITGDERKFVARMKKERPKWYRQYMVELILVIGVKIILLIVNWKLGLFVLVIPHLYAGWGIVSTNYWQHDGCDEKSEYNHSRNFTGKFLNFVAFNNGYHTIHHAKPHLHWSLLPEAHEKEIVPHIHPNLNLTHLLPFLWKSHIYPAKRLDYLGKPVKVDKNMKYEDWTKDADIDSNGYQLGVEH